MYHPRFQLRFTTNSEYALFAENFPLTPSYLDMQTTPAASGCIVLDRQCVHIQVSSPECEFHLRFRRQNGDPLDNRMNLEVRDSRFMSLDQKQCVVMTYDDFCHMERRLDSFPPSNMLQRICPGDVGLWVGDAMIDRLFIFRDPLVEQRHWFKIRCVVRFLSLYRRVMSTRRRTSHVTVYSARPTSNAMVMAM